MSCFKRSYLFTSRAVRNCTPRLPASVWPLAAIVFAFASCIGFCGVSFAQQSEVESQPAHPQREIGDIRRDMEAFIRNSKQEDDYNLQVGSVVDLCFLHHEIVTDPRYGRNSRLQSFRAMTADRLRRYSRYVDVQIRRHQREQDRLERERRRSDDGSNNEVPDDSGENGEDEFDPPSNDEGQTDSDNAVNDAMNDSMFSMGSATGGPVNVFGYLGGNFAPPWDHGFELQELIERTINPEFWKANGGDGVIHYYRPSRVLVVSASWEMHDRLETFLYMLR